uniref:Uncharacterized protein n=1 Tax=Romanomermis culicivorax TaxID=13658 RepID=A0A915L3W9_ROMCU
MSILPKPELFKGQKMKLNFIACCSGTFILVFPMEGNGMQLTQCYETEEKFKNFQKVQKLNLILKKFKKNLKN